MVSTYTPARHEAGWLMKSLTQFFEEGLLSDVLFHIQGGKEASVYCCAAGPNVDAEWLAVKVYRPRQHRNLRNDGMYREGRETLSEEGRTIKQTNHRVMRAVARRSGFGERVRHQSWLMYEFNALKTLYEDGAAVPKPWSASHNAIVMDYIGDEHAAAPSLTRLQLPLTQAEDLFDQVIDTVDIMLQRGLIHGDLSAYNILLHEGRAVVIDFPQIVRIGVNRHSRDLFERDLRRVGDYFEGQGVQCDVEALIETLWERYTISHEQLIEPVLPPGWGEP